MFSSAVSQASCSSSSSSITTAPKTTNARVSEADTPQQCHKPLLKDMGAGSGCVHAVQSGMQRTCSMAWVEPPFFVESCIGTLRKRTREVGIEGHLLLT